MVSCLAGFNCFVCLFVFINVGQSHMPSVIVLFTTTSNSTIRINFPQMLCFVTDGVGNILFSMWIPSASVSLCIFVALYLLT